MLWGTKTCSGKQRPTLGNKDKSLGNNYTRTKKGRSWVSSFRFVMPLIELWHMKYAFLNGIFSAHWASVTMKGDFGLRYCAEKLGRKINPTKLDFYPGDRLMEVVLNTMTLNFVRYASKLYIWF